MTAEEYLRRMHRLIIEEGKIAQAFEEAERLCPTVELTSDQERGLDEILEYAIIVGLGSGELQQRDGKIVPKRGRPRMAGWMGVVLPSATRRTACPPQVQGSRVGPCGRR